MFHRIHLQLIWSPRPLAVSPTSIPLLNINIQHVQRFNFGPCHRLLFLFVLYKVRTWLRSIGSQCMIWFVFGAEHKTPSNDRNRIQNAFELHRLEEQQQSWVPNLRHYSKLPGYLTPGETIQHCHTLLEYLTHDMSRAYRQFIFLTTRCSYSSCQSGHGRDDFHLSKQLFHWWRQLICLLKNVTTSLWP